MIAEFKVKVMAARRLDAASLLLTVEDGKRPGAAADRPDGPLDIATMSIKAF